MILIDPFLLLLATACLVVICFIVGTACLAFLISFAVESLFVPSLPRADGELPNGPDGRPELGAEASIPSGVDSYDALAGLNRDQAAAIGLKKVPRSRCVPCAALRRRLKSVFFRR